MVKKSKKNIKKNSYNNRWFLIVTAVFLFFVLISLIMKESESFANIKNLILGYPRPQGNLPNYKYGTNLKNKEKQRKEWNNVLQNIKEKFGIPVSRTILV